MGQNQHACDRMALPGSTLRNRRRIFRKSLWNRAVRAVCGGCAGPDVYRVRCRRGGEKSQKPYRRELARISPPECTGNRAWGTRKVHNGGFVTRCVETSSVASAIVYLRGRYTLVWAARLGGPRTREAAGRQRRLAASEGSADAEGRMGRPAGRSSRGRFREGSDLALEVCRRGGMVPGSRRRPAGWFRRQAES